MPNILVHRCLNQQLSLPNRMYLVIIYVSFSNKTNEYGDIFSLIFLLPIFTFEQGRIWGHLPEVDCKATVYPWKLCRTWRHKIRSMFLPLNCDSQVYSIRTVSDYYFEWLYNVTIMEFTYCQYVVISTHVKWYWSLTLKIIWTLQAQSI